VFKIPFGKIMVVIMMVIVFYGYVWLEGLVHVQVANISVCSNERPSLLNMGLQQKVKQVVELVKTRKTNLAQIEATKEEMKVQKATTLEE